MIYCAVPGCASWMRPETAERRWGTAELRFICARHWRRLTKAEKGVWARFSRLRLRYGLEAVNTSRAHRVFDALIRRSDLLS